MRIHSLRLVGASLALTICACMPFASHAEYADYRAIRLAHASEERALAMTHYVRSHPDGFWTREVQAKRRAAEDDWWRRSNTTTAGVDFYLRAYPDGKYVAQARPRRSALAFLERQRGVEGASANRAKRTTRARAADVHRMWGSRAIAFWLRTFLGVEGWGRAIDETARSNDAFSSAYGRSPRPRCSRTECVKAYESAYAIPIPGATRLDRTLTILLRLRMPEGRLARTEILLPGRGFSRWYEREHGTPITDEDAQDRERALRWANERIAPLLQRLAPEARNVDLVPEPIEPPTVRFVVSNVRAPGSPQAPDVQALQTATVAGEASLVLPIALTALETDDLRIVVFAAAAEDTGAAYDGLFIERRIEASATTP